MVHPTEPIETLASQWNNMSLCQDVENASFAFKVDLQEPMSQIHGEEFFLMGTVCALRNYNFKAVEKTMRNTWNPLFTVEMREIEPNLYLFFFTNRLNINKVLQGGPWRFNDYLLATKEVEPGKIVPKADLNYVAFRVQIYGISVL